MVQLALLLLVPHSPHTLALRPPLPPLPTQPLPTALSPPRTSLPPSRLLLPTPRLSQRATLPTTRPSPPITLPSLPQKRPLLTRTRPSFPTAPQRPPTSTMLRQRQHNDLVLFQSLRSLRPLGSSGTRDATQSALSIVAVGSLLALLCCCHRCVRLPFLSYACDFFSPIRVMSSIVSPHPRTPFFHFFPQLLPPSRNLCDHGLRLSFYRHGVPPPRGHFISQYTPLDFVFVFSIVVDARVNEKTHIVCLGIPVRKPSELAAADSRLQFDGSFLKKSSQNFVSRCGARHLGSKAPRTAFSFANLAAVRSGGL